MVPMEMRQKRLQPRRQPGAEFLRGNASFPEISCARCERTAEPAEAAMDLKPKARHLAEIGMARPDRPGVALEIETQIVGPAGAGIEVEVGGHRASRWRAVGNRKLAVVHVQSVGRICTIADCLLPSACGSKMVPATSDLNALI